MPARIVSGIYLIRNTVNGKVYVGSALSLRFRFKRHRTELRHGNHHSNSLQQAWDQYGEKAFTFSCLEPVDCKEHLIEREQVWMDRLAAAVRGRGYNVSSTAGSQLGIKRSEAYLAKKRGTRRSAEALLRMSLAQKLVWETRSRTMSAQGRANISAGHMGKKRSATHAANISRGKKGKGISAITIEAARLVNTGRKQTAEHIAKAHRGQKGRKDSAETRERKRQAAVRREGLLTEADVLAIRASGEAGTVLAKRYGVSHYTIWDIRKRRSWTHI